MESTSPSPPSWNSPYRFRVAFRLLRARKINLISIVGVMLGVGAIIVVLSVMDGFRRQLRSMIRGSLSDLIVSIDPDTADSYAALKKAVEKVNGVEAVTLQKSSYGLLPYTEYGEKQESYLPVYVVGILPHDEKKVSQVIQSMVSGPDYPKDPFAVPPDTPNGGFVQEERPRVVISEWLAKKISPLFPKMAGDSLGILTVQKGKTADGGDAEYRIHDYDAIITRLYKTGNSDFDKLHVYVDLDSLTTRKIFFGVPEGTSTELRIKVKNYDKVDQVIPDVARAVGPFDPAVAAHPYDHIKTWEQRQHYLLLAVNNEKFILAFVMFFIVVVACFTIFATLTMTVIEKTRDIGVLLALGATPGGICSIFMLNGVLVGVFGAALGYGAGLLVAHNVNPIRAFLRDRFGWDIFPPDIYLFDKIPTYIDQRTAFYFAAGAALCALVFSIIPAIRAARLRPVRALRYE